MPEIRTRLSTTIAVFCATMMLQVGAGFAQQFVDETNTRFPSPNPTDYSNQLTIGDIDADGDLDIIFANGGGYSSPTAPQLQRVYINDGTGVFTDESNARIGFSGRARGVELGDIDGDDDLDVVFVQDFNLEPQLFVNDGTGFFTNETLTRLPAMTLASSRGQFGDVDNDGDLDLYIVSGAANRFSCGQYRLYINDGNGFFTDGTLDHLPIGPVCNNMDAIFGDIDNDFDLDIRTGSTGTGNSRLYGNDGSGVFSVVNTIPSDSSCYSYDFGDIDGDGDLDLIGANAGSGTKELLLDNDGSGTFSDISGNISPNPNQDDNDSKFLDYDDDGDLDLIIARLGGAEKVYNNDGTGVFTQVAGVITSISDSTLDIMVADLTGDGKLDIVTAQGESGNFQNRIYVNSGPADTQDPRIVDTEQLADTADTVGPYVVRALILDDMSSDRNFFDKGIELHYTVNSGSPQTLPMAHSGGQVYRGEIPGIAGGVVEYHVTAMDFNGNEGFGDTKTFTVTAGGIPCEDIEKFLARCNPTGTFQSRVKFFDNSHSGETVTVEYDGTPHVLNIFNNIAGFQQPAAGIGSHTIELVEPAGCFVPVTKSCAVAPSPAAPTPAAPKPAN